MSNLFQHFDNLSSQLGVSPNELAPVVDILNLLLLLDNHLESLFLKLSSAVSVRDHNQLENILWLEVVTEFVLGNPLEILKLIHIRCGE